MMNLYLLKLNEEAKRELGYYDLNHGFVVKANSFKRARETANEYCKLDAGFASFKNDVWLYDNKSTCKLIGKVPAYLEKATDAIVLSDWRSG